jgi:hypothetical protein
MEVAKLIVKELAKEKGFKLRSSGSGKSKNIS